MLNYINYFDVSLSNCALFEVMIVAERFLVMFCNSFEEGDNLLISDFCYFCRMLHPEQLDLLEKLLDDWYHLYSTSDFIELDPISIPHKFAKKEDVEISAFLISTIAWGNRTSIVLNGNKLMSLMDNAPSDFVRNHQPSDLKVFDRFVHRTFNSADVQFFIVALQSIYHLHGGLEAVFKVDDVSKNAFDAILNFRRIFFEIEHEIRVEKHVSNPAKKSACKRINMFLRWMVRHDKSGVDFGIWKGISPAQLICPLDVHTARVARKLGLLERKQNDRLAAEELTDNLSYFCPHDPVKYDFALFGAGVNGLF